MRVQTEEWRRFIPGVRMYKGKKTLFYNGEILFDEDDEYLIYDEEERDSWEVIIVLPGVEIIPEYTFTYCTNVETVIMSDTVRRIERNAFTACSSLKFVRLSRSIEYIGDNAFVICKALTSIFIPPSCLEIGYQAFWGCKKLIIFHVPQQTQLGYNVIANTALLKASHFETNKWGDYDNAQEVHEWLKGINQGETFELHRACSSFNPSTDTIFGIVKRRGFSSFKKKNKIDMTAFDYLDRNPFIENEIDERALMKRYILEMMGETV